MSIAAVQSIDSTETLLGTISYEDCLIEIQTAELPPKSLLALAEDFYTQVKSRLVKAELGFKDLVFFATPRRLAILVEHLASNQADQFIQRKGPSKSAAFDVNGKPTPACIGFARSCGVGPEDLRVIKEAAGEWMGYQQHVLGKTIQQLLPSIVEQALNALAIPKRMRWGNGDAQFVRPVHSVILLYGDKVIAGNILGCQSNRLTRGHRFHTKDEISINHAFNYSTILEKDGFVIVDYAKRRQIISDEINACVKETLHKTYPNAQVFMTTPELLDEVTGLVEWPVALCGEFDEKFLQLPQEVLISAMQDHQRYFPVADGDGQLLPYFITVSNIASTDAARVIKGNERVLRARLADADFFYQVDQRESLDARVIRLKGIINQAKLGTLYDKAQRLSQLTAEIFVKLHGNKVNAERAGLLAKADLTTQMVNEFPELQGVIGGYYAKNAGELPEVGVAISEQYMPRFGGDALPISSLGQALALADKLDLLVGAFGINQIPTGDKDPFGLRRAAIGVLRILVEKNLLLDLQKLLELSVRSYEKLLTNPHTIPQVLSFIHERMRSWYQEQNISAEVFNSVMSLGITFPYDMHERILAVEVFKSLPEAEHLAAANKRVSNILAKYTENFAANSIDMSLIDNAAEKVLATQLEAKRKQIGKLAEKRQYADMLVQLADLREPIDNFFDQVMVMVDDKALRENRLLLLRDIRALFLNVADIAYLQK